MKPICLLLILLNMPNFAVALEFMWPEKMNLKDRLKKRFTTAGRCDNPPHKILFLQKINENLIEKIL